MFKRFIANQKLKKYRREFPKRNIDSNGNIIIDECHIVCFVNEQYPKEHQMISLVDSTSSWFYSNGSTQESLKWSNRKSSPIILKSADHYELQRIFDQYSPIFLNRRTKSFFAGELVAICMGPVWNSRLSDLNNFERITY